MTVNILFCMVLWIRRFTPEWILDFAKQLQQRSLLPLNLLLIDLQKDFLNTIYALTHQFPHSSTSYLKFLEGTEYQSNSQSEDLCFLSPLITKFCKALNQSGRTQIRFRHFKQRVSVMKGNVTKGSSELSASTLEFKPDTVVWRSPATWLVWGIEFSLSGWQQAHLLLSHLTAPQVQKFCIFFFFCLYVCTCVAAHRSK